MRDTVPDSVSPAVLEVLQSGFAHDPALRPPTVTELLARLERASAQIVQAKLPANAPPVPPPAVVAVPPAPVKPLVQLAGDSLQVQRRERELLGRAAADAERQARKDALRRRLREHIEHEERERLRQPPRSKVSSIRTVSALNSVVAGATLLEDSEDAPGARLDYASAAPAPRAPDAQAAPPTTASARSRQRDRFTDDSADGPELVLLPAGRFQMGSTQEERQLALDAGARKAWLEREAPVHWVDIAKPFAIGRHPVTVGQWRQFVTGTRWKGASGVHWAAPGFAQDDDHPVVGVTWHDAQLYLRWLSTRTGKRYRLASEAEWEYACRAGSTTPFSFGDTIRPEQANYDARFAWSGNASAVPRRGTAPVGSYPANPWGLCDMHGNVWEWVQDVMHESYDGAPPDGGAWEEGGDQLRRVLRGGSWLYHPRYLRSAVRNGFAAKLSNDKVGFRVVREVE
jgi:formylglycine-generating enzyme required for sulfatase activity